MSDYHYIGKDGKTVLARDLEDERDALRARLSEVERERDAAIVALSEQARKRGEAEAALATARRDAYERAAKAAMCHFGSEPTDEQMHDVCDIAAAIRALANEAET